jgi:site-specific DNA-methyltransferase (adenine-specific)
MNPMPTRVQPGQALGRFPANIIHDGSPEVLELFPVTKSGVMVAGQQCRASKGKGGYSGGFPDTATAADTFGDSGSAARFFYCAKASKSDRDEGCEGLEERHVATLNDYVKPSEGRTADKNGELKRNTHPTVKPTDLMRYLCRLITPPNGVVLDPFMGSGSTGKAAVLEGFGFIGIEREAEYVRIASARIEHAHNQHIAKRPSLSEISDLGCRDDVYKTSLTINVL